MLLGNMLEKAEGPAKPESTETAPREREQMIRRGHL